MKSFEGNQNLWSLSFFSYFFHVFLSSAMTLDMWTLRALFLLLWFSGGSWCEDCNMTKVYFESRNFHSRLHWDEVKIQGREVRYTVRYNEYGKSPTPMTECQNISETFCDLSSVMTDIRSKYFVKIMANESCLGELTHLVLSEKPSLEAPTLSVETLESSLIVTVKTPMGPQNRSIQEITQKCHKSGQSSVNYFVSLTHPKSKAGKKYENETGTITVSNLDANTEYCGVVYYKLTHPSITGQSENTTFCRTLPGAAKPWISVFIVSGLVAVFLLITFALILCQQYVTRKRNLPKALIMSINPPPIFKLEPKLEITNVKVYPASQWNGKKSDLALPDVLRKSKAVSPAGYAAQDYRNQDWHSHSYTNEQVGPVSGQSARSSTSYSLVMGRKETWDRGQSSCDIDSGLGDSISPDLSPLTEEDLFQVTPPAEPGKDLGMIKPDSLMLPVSRGVNGKLAFFGLEFPNSEITPLAASGERTLLLTDLVSLDESNWPDNGSSLDYRKSYLPNGVPPSCLEIHSTETISKVLLSDFTANYRENWVPGILPDPLEYNRKCIISDIICDNQLHELVEPEENVGESPPQLKANFLGEWMVQIQG